jgi:hypothetical protein
MRVRKKRVDMLPESRTRGQFGHTGRITIDGGGGGWLMGRAS